MKINSHLSFIALLALLLLPLISTAQEEIVREPQSEDVRKDIKVCPENPQFLSYSKTELTEGFAALPKMIFVALQADYYIESKDKKFRIQSFQNFKRPESKLICGSLSEKSHSFAMYAPTLIDRSEDKKVGDSWWQFQLMVDGKKFGVWNTKSRLFSKSGSFEAKLKDFSVKVFQVDLDPNLYEIVLQRAEGDFIETISVRYDAHRHIQLSK